MASSTPPFEPTLVREAVFISYAREDGAVAEAIAELLRSRGVEVWFDRKELVGGDSWDAKIRRQIRECALFLAVVSQNTNARLEGYFRREWKLAVDRTHDMADEKAFLLPVVIDEQPPGTVRVPEKFFEVQWYTLPGGVPDEELADRVRALLTGAASGTTNAPFAVRRAAAPPSSAAPGPGSEAIQPQAGGRGVRWAIWLPVWLGVLGGAGYLGYRYWPRPGVAAPPKAVATKPASQPSKPKTAAPTRSAEVRQLVAKATTLWEKWDEATRGDWALADELCKRAVELDPGDGEAWATYAHVTFGLYEFFHDENADDMTRQYAERAARLLPTSKNVRLALANAYRTNPRTLPEAERALRQLATAMPEDKRVLRTLGDTLRDRDKFEEAISYYDKAAALPGGDPLALLAKSFALERLGRYADAEAAVDQSLALKKGEKAAAVLRKVDCLLNFRGDLDSAAKVLTRVPAAALLDDRAVSLICQLWLWKREPDNCLDVLNSVTRDFLQGYYWAGAPKHWLLGKVHQLAGRPAAAEAQWRLALKAIDKARTEFPDSVDLLYWSANLHARLGERADAEKDLNLALQLSAGGQVKRATHVAAIQLLLGRKKEALDLIEAKLRTAEGPSLRNELRFDPAFDELRDDPRFRAMVGPAP